MTDLNAALRAAILGALEVIPTDWDGLITALGTDGYHKNLMPEGVADTIIAAIQPVLDEGVTVEWGMRGPDYGVQIVRTNRAKVERLAYLGGLAGHTLVSRRIGAWEEVDDAP